MGRALNMFGMGRFMVEAALWGVCLICFHAPPYGCGRSMGSVLNVFGLGRPMPAAAL